MKLKNLPTPAEPRPSLEGHPHPSAARPRWWLWVLIAVVLAVGARWLLQRQGTTAGTAPRSAAPAVPVVAVPVRQGDIPVILAGLGSVAAFNTVTVKSRTDGQLVRVAFQEGQFVHEGDLLAEIDPRPFAAQLAQAEGQLARDQAQLKDAKINLERYRQLLAKQFISKQQYDSQAAAVGQFEGAVKVDRGLIDNAKLQLTYSRIIAPISGRVGLRLVDVGNIVHASDPTGLLVITQIQPVAVLFTIPEDDLPSVLKKLAAGDHLPVEAYERSGRTRIAAGELLTADNQIDPATGTSRLKAVFQNADSALFPNQFVNVRLTLDVEEAVLIVPVVAIQRGPQGIFVYVVQSDQTVAVRPITVGVTQGTDAQVVSGLSPNEIIVVDGVDKLRAGSKVQPQPPSNGRAPGKPAA